VFINTSQNKCSRAVPFIVAVLLGLGAGWPCPADDAAGPGGAENKSPSVKPTPGANPLEQSLAAKPAAKATAPSNPFETAAAHPALNPLEQAAARPALNPLEKAAAATENPFEKADRLAR